jgi:hypothetical protein
MSKVKIIALADELGKTVNELLKIKSSKLTEGLHYSGYGKNTYLTEEAVELIRLSFDVPLAVPDKIRALVLMEARNPRWVYAKLEGHTGKVPVAIPRKLRGKLLGKRINVDAITDASGGTTYRHEMLGV